MSIRKLITERWSPRAFSEKAVEQEKLEQLFEAARWAASSRNEQPWRFVYATKTAPEAWQQLFNTLMEGNQVWAEKAPVLIAITAKMTFDYKNKPNKHAWYDTGQAVATLLLQATDLGLYAHQMAGFYPDKARAALYIPEGYEPVAMMALGYIGDKKYLPENLQEREAAPRKRKPLNEFVFRGRWKAH